MQINRTDKSMKRIQKNMLALSKEIKELFKTSYKAKERSPAVQLLYDNFYLIDRSIKEVLSVPETARILIDDNGNSVLGNIVLESCKDGVLPSLKVFREIIRTESAAREIKEEEAELLPVLFLSSAVIKLSEKIKEDAPIEELTPLLGLLNQEDLIPMEEIILTESPVERLYQQETSGIYKNSDSKTRRLFRYMTGRIALKLGRSETEVARKMLKLSEKGSERSLPAYECHVGYYIRKEYERLFPKISLNRYQRLILWTPAIISALLAYRLSSPLFIIFSWFPLFILSKFIIDRIISRKNPPVLLPRMEYHGLIPDGSKTLAVLSVLADGPDSFSRISEHLKELIQRNPAENLNFCVLCDYKESSMPILPEDKAIKRSLEKAVESLNSAYGNRFIGILRERSFSKSEQKFTGFDRKRGAVEQLVCLMHGEEASGLQITGPVEILKNTVYILALDADTKPLMDIVPELVSIADHPLNQPVISGGRVKKGYGIIAPKMTTEPESSFFSPFTLFFGGINVSGVYDSVCGEFYQDVFSQSIFSGKGLIHSDSFYKLCCHRFLPETVLSHDILEGGLLRTGFAGDVECRDSFPKTSAGYFKRLHRWIRGDAMNLPFTMKKVPLKDGVITNPLGKLTRFQLADNIRRAAEPAILFCNLFRACLVSETLAVWVTAITFLALVFPYLYGAVSFLWSQGAFSLSRRYYSNAMTKTRELLAQAGYSVTLLPVSAAVSADGLIRGLWRRYISHKKTLEWTTAAQSDKLSKDLTSRIAAFVLCLLLTLAAPYTFLKIIGLILALFPVILFWSDVPIRKLRLKIPPEKERRLLEDAAAMWQFYEDFAAKENNWLPPDNVQLAPVKAICKRTSPTNIGMYLLSLLGARDLNLIDSHGLAVRGERVISSVEALEKYNGNLFNWYDTDTLKLSPNPFVSSVDSGNLVCCLIAFKEGLKEYAPESPRLFPLIERAERLIDQTDLRIFYQPQKELFSIGINPETGKLSPHFYDLLMSEARMLSYASIAKRLVPKKHWKKLGRTMKRSGVYAGAVAYSGTMFEYFMPELLLKSSYGSLTYESLQYCISCQKQRGRSLKLPYGVSESGYYAFDGSLNYQYKAHGVGKCGLRNGLDDEYIVSPYSSYLSMSKDFAGAEENLRKLKKYGAYGYYGYYEAVDFSENPTKGAVVKSYMAHHVGMSITAAVNCLKDGIFQRRFLRDSEMLGAKELLEEGCYSLSFMAEDAGGDGKPPQGFEPMKTELSDRFSLEEPKCRLLCNGEYSVIAADNGATVSLFEGRELFKRTTDLLRAPAGCFFAVEAENETFSITLLPEYKINAERSAEFSENSVSYYCNSDNLNVGMKITLPEGIPAEIRDFAVKNTEPRERSISLLCYLEPTLMKHEDFSAHPAFMKLFLSLERREEDGLIIAYRKDRRSDRVQYMAIGFTEHLDFEVCFDREKVLTSPYGAVSAFKNPDSAKGAGSRIPDPCVFIRVPLSLSGKEQKTVRLFMVTAFSMEELLRSAAAIRSRPKESAFSGVLRESSIEGRIASLLLPKVIFKSRDCYENDSARAKNTLPASSLWKFGISGDIPMVIFEVAAGTEEERIQGAIKCHRGLKLSGISLDLVFLISENNGEATVLSLMQEAKWTDCIGSAGGIHIIKEETASDEEKTLLFAAAVHIVPKNGIRIGAPGRELLPMKITPISPVSTKNTWEWGGGSVKIHGKSGAPWCHILANPVFGTLVSHRSLGFTYAMHSRENKLTPWLNDSMTDNRGEMLLLKTSDTLFDLVNGSTAEFSETKARYTGTTELFSCNTMVEISGKGFCKKISVEIEAKKDISFTVSYYTEPVSGVTRNGTRMLRPERTKKGLLFQNPFNEAVKGFAGVLSDCGCIVSTDRLRILSGDFSKETVQSGELLCGCLSRAFELKKGQTTKIQFYLVWGASKEAALSMPELFVPLEKASDIKIETPDQPLNFLWNNWLLPQTVRGRLYARTGFYQNSGAFGFRDQLQDSCSALLCNPKITRVQIIRACLAQFIEGDVLHWWHQFPDGTIKGVRTRYSDDLLWLPYALCEYTDKTGDFDLLSLKLPFSDGELLEEAEQEKYLALKKSRTRESVYEHCKRAISHALRKGSHGLLLMGCGDWNDGYNGVGAKGAGESVWLTEFMIMLLKRFSKLSDHMGERAAGESYRSIAKELSEAVEANAWDGEWYLRAFYDDGTPMGSHESEECKIDSLSQSFAVLAELPDKKRNAEAIESACRWLIDWKLGIIKLFAPPFSGKDRTAGYAASYPEGVRENGGQYTHGAVWLAVALLQSGLNREGYQCLEMLNPMSRYPDKNALTPYVNEPYYLSADVYGNEHCPGRGGWSIYTGAAGWYCRAVFEWLLGIKINKVLTVHPAIPPEWNGFKAELSYRGTKIKIEVSRTGEASMTDNAIKAEYVPFDQKEHIVKITI